MALIVAFSEQSGAGVLSFLQALKLNNVIKSELNNNFFIKIP